MRIIITFFIRYLDSFTLSSCNKVFRFFTNFGYVKVLPRTLPHFYIHEKTKAWDMSASTCHQSVPWIFSISTPSYFSQESFSLLTFPLSLLRKGRKCPSPPHGHFMPSTHCRTYPLGFSSPIPSSISWHATQTQFCIFPSKSNMCKIPWFYKW